VNAQNNAGTDLDGDRNAGKSALHLQRAGAGCGKRSGDERGDDRSQPDCGGGRGNGTGDNSNAVAMAGLANQAIVNGQTPINYYSNFVSTLGATVSEVQTENTAQNASVTQLQTQNNALSSVNLNDEAAAMSTLETSYQAASQVFALLNTVMASALNLGEQTTVT
jgi:flagellar hook-associated protein 1